jgi:hypothetical protein
MARKQINKIGDKLANVNDSFSINIYDNGFLIEISGRDEDNEYRNAKIMVPTVEQLLELVREAVTLPRDDE